ncbi:PREDICTED: defensin-like protein 4 [Camelina sativa]|uniref:Defensin-like protein 4 n=1 Tax=Camelina sativa TaxID=90675 RepID=A0ABM0YUY1_CAMSA|nr:PREDICTED: defensin-like protein 4 [Camelina sativa]XP_010506245.1 PREDICTED: defensin-like protein 4 [Camelina sativa]
MAMATKLVSTLAIFFVLVLMISEAHADECLKEYGGDVGFQFCAPRIFPSFCVSRCQADKGAKGGKCIWGDDGVKCLCDFCGEELTEQFIRQV